MSHEFQRVSTALGVQLQLLPAADERDLAEVFANLPQRKIEGLVIGTDAFFNSHSAKLADLALRQRLPAIFQYQEFTEAGGLMSLGGIIADAYRIAGVYVGRILKGEKTTDLAVQQVTKVELILNLKTAKALGLHVPASIFARADHLIE